MSWYLQKSLQSVDLLIENEKNRVMDGYADSNGSNGGPATTSNAPLHVQRPVYRVEDLNEDTQYEKPHSPLKAKMKEAAKSVRPLSCLLKTMPILDWLPSYDFKNLLIGDIISGITVAVMHIPQGMAYALLGNVPPIVGIYMAFFPVLVYLIFGTSKHVSIGTFAIVCLMTGQVVSDYTSVEILQNGTRAAVQPEVRSELSEKGEYTNVQVACTVTFTVAVIQLIMYILRLGAVATLLSDTLVNAFTCAAAFHVVSSQLKDLFGLQTKKTQGNFQLVYRVYDSAVALPHANLVACLISLITCVTIYFNNEFLKPWLAKRTRIPFPIELAVVVTGTAVSYFFNLNEKHDISVVGFIPTGLPKPALPLFELIPSILLDAFVITMVSYTISMSMALIFARKCAYEIDSNQELLALGLANTNGAFFSCMPCTASLSRSAVQHGVGGSTQLASVVSAGLLLTVLLWIGPLFQQLPRCVLASIIVVALRGVLLQGKAIARHWKLSRWDASVWIITFLTTLLVQISVGLFVGAAASCISVLVQGQRPRACILGAIPGTDLYLDIKRHKTVRELTHIKIFRYVGGLSFLSRDGFRALLARKTELDAQDVLRRRARKALKGVGNGSLNEDFIIKCLVLDFSGVTFVDPSGVEVLRQLQGDYGQLGVQLYIAGCSGPVYEVIEKCNRIEKTEKKFVLFPTIHDAVLYAQANVIDSLKDV